MAGVEKMVDRWFSAPSPHLISVASTVSGDMVVPIKTDGGFISLSPETIEAIADAVARRLAQ